MQTFLRHLFPIFLLIFAELPALSETTLTPQSNAELKFKASSGETWKELPQPLKVKALWVNATGTPEEFNFPTHSEWVWLDERLVLRVTIELPQEYKIQLKSLTNLKNGNV